MRRLLCPEFHLHRLRLFLPFKQPTQCRHLLLVVLLWPVLKQGWSGMKCYTVKINFDPSNSMVAWTFPGLCYLYSLNSCTGCEPQLLAPKLLLSALAPPPSQPPPALAQQYPPHAPSHLFQDPIHTDLLQSLPELTQTISFLSQSCSTAASLTSPNTITSFTVC